MGRSYYSIIEITDHGPYVTKLVLPISVNVKAEEVKPECFSVYVERKDKKGEILKLSRNWLEKTEKELSKGYCVVEAAYPSCSQGVRREEGEFVTLEMKYGPLDSLSAAIACPSDFNEFIFSDYRITQIAEIPAEEERLTGLVFDLCAGNTMKQAEKFLHGISSYEEEPLKYGYFVPQTGNGRRPLIIWLHGAGEGGQDPTIAYTGNKVVNLASDAIQAKFGGAYMLVPQTPTFWMNDGSGQYGRSGKSKYGVALKALIDEFIFRNDAVIDTNRIYIGGCSNGGFMTMRMVLDYPDFFAAAYPVCEALFNDVISDADIEAIKHVPIWFTHSKDDLIVKPEETVIPTYKRLIKAGAKNVHFSLFDKVVDIHGLFADEKGEPFNYIGHFSWIYALNDDCHLDYDGKSVVVEGKKVSLMDWLAMQSK
ncbi:prolyl oligopeptidase family serine peptidase [Paenibacillus alginolyticus]|uniref:Prolyl oligopeptidase family serine peptidase n=1 Tax=Paenibacillus alginolyticus TaxID=59839 RepID=A0ABT4G5G6_9BACL|nr:prolyl oligopeptidase family serine peptidase [Paenibacillus alginolyticus]MCY9665365.1 prolyl oligopeptidase family serine peptidase [Paenibacillus alginolyticus]MCY9691414.1 prolyl oligopeptidase family serine peptidase [Paenibacillus alginolyticus]MEC0146522.1 prolyl oligopeptidase family serine peptidase [Paenibacillus alginolyticus]